MPIEKLVPLCREFGVLSMIDGAHAPGHIPLNMRELDADFYAGKSVSILSFIKDLSVYHIKLLLNHLTTSITDKDPIRRYYIY
jgi:isopenicillin-N epimerase